MDYLTQHDARHMLTVSPGPLNVQNAILSHSLFVKFKRIAPHGPLAQSKLLVPALVMEDKHSVSDRAINNLSQSTWCFRRMEGRGRIPLAVGLKSTTFCKTE